MSSSAVSIPAPTKCSGRSCSDGQEIRPVGNAVISGSGDLVEHVRHTTNAIGVVNVAWLKGVDQECPCYGTLAARAWRPDSTQAGRQSLYSRTGICVQRILSRSTRRSTSTRASSTEILRLGFISFATSVQGQKVFLNSGLVPVTMPVRLIQLTSEQVK